MLAQAGLNNNACGGFPFAWGLGYHFFFCFCSVIPGEPLGYPSWGKPRGTRPVDTPGNPQATPMAPKGDPPGTTPGDPCRSFISFANE
jgi:hypothetical protein